MRKRDKYKPAVSKTVLIFIAGLVWICVGSALVLVAFLWLSEASHVNNFLFGGLGVVLALFIHHFGFLKIVDKNLARLLPMEDKKCLFSFMPWKSYLLILVMVAMGILLRSSPIPKHFLAILYTGIGLALILSSMRYLRVFLKELKTTR